ncbi:rhamnan synthesis F family protein [Thiorhodococcus fuscus]|uniref:Rhamnan synthesis F family protein n=1 Tax=Thiorhodococcus fuscus TaxID=527200 RepID=A0ABW4YAX3_9GAMM
MQPDQIDADQRLSDQKAAPLVSVIVRTKDRHDTLQYALDSCVRQDYRPLEVVLVNDGGADVSDLLCVLAPSGIKTRLISHPSSLGRCAAGNAGLEAASGDCLIFLDDDDWFEPDHIRHLVESLSDGSNRLAAYAGVSYRESPEASEIHRFNSEYDPVAQRLENRIPIHAVLFSRRLLDLGCRLDSNLDVFEDWDFWLQCARYTEFVHVDRVSAGYRAGGGSNAGWGQSAERVAQARQRLLAKWKDLWSAEELDQALRWAQDRLAETQEQLGKAMEDHRDLHETHLTLHDAHLKLHEEHQAQDEACRGLVEAHESLASQHRDLIEAHRNLEGLHGSLSQAHRLLRTEHGDLLEAHKRVQFRYQEVEQAYRATLASTSWRLTWPLRAVSLAAQRTRSGVRAVLGPLPVLVATLLEARRVAGGWRRLTVKGVVRLRQDGLSGFGRRARFHMLRRSPTKLPQIASEDAPVFCPSGEQMAVLPAFRCGIMVHVYFTDLFPELCRYLARMPISYRLMISVTSQEARAAVLEQGRVLGSHAELSVKVVPNRGRDIAPLLVAFGDEIAELDIVGHIHTKKSSYTGSSRFGEDWRRYLLDAMLGDGRRVCAALAQFAADPGVGIIYPETFPGLPYWAHTWLSNRTHGGELLAAMGHGDVDFGQYIDYPAGSMFWARTEALRPLLDLGLTLADFPPEQGQTDNTLHHAVERCLGFAAAAAGLSRRLQFLEEGRVCFRSYSPFVLQQYHPGALAERMRLVCTGDRVLSFDLFDTLLVRPFARPEAVFWMLEERIERAFGLVDFTAKRRQAESVARSRLAPGEDVGIERIYEVMGELESLDPALTRQVLDLEVATEQALLMANPVAVDLLRELHDQGRRLLLVSDMYLGESYLRPVLRRLKLDLFDRLYVSADTGRRKDRGDVWEYLLDQEGIAKEQLQHVGDNEHSDVQVLVDRGFPHPLHLMRPAALLGVVPGGQALIQVLRRRLSWRNELVLGLIANRVSRSLHAGGVPHQPFADPRVFGYGLIGPIVFVFMAWLMRRLQQDQVTSVRFLSREGWLLDRLYRRMCEHPAVRQALPDLPPSQYFYCSRSVVGLAAIRQEADFAILLGSHYDGSLRQLLGARFGLRDLGPFTAKLGETALDQVFRLPEDHLEILSILRRCLPEIQAESTQLSELIRDYWAESRVADDRIPALVDIGYSGTIQLGLMRTLDEPMNGYYFVTNASAGRVVERGGRCDACFGNLLPLEQMNDETIHRYALVLEALMTSPDGQLAGFDRVEGRPEPRFKPAGAAQRQFATLECIHEGVLDYCCDVMDVLGADFIRDGWDLAAISDLLSLVVTRRLDIGSLEEALSVEDQYCGNQELSVLDFYDQQRAGAGGA